MNLVLSNQRTTPERYWESTTPEWYWESTFVTNLDVTTPFETVEKQATETMLKVFGKDYGEIKGYEMNMMLSLWQVIILTHNPHTVFKYPLDEE